MKKPLFASAVALVLTAILFTSCSEKETPPETVDSPKTVLDEAPYFRGKLDGQAFSIAVGEADGTAQYNNEKYENTPDSSEVNYSMAYNEFTSGEYITLSKGTSKFLTATGINNSTLQSYFAKGTYPFAQPTADPFENTEGITVTIVHDGTNYSTEYGPQPSTSEFKIIETATKTSLGKFTVVVRATVKCTVYTPDGASSKVISDGSIISAFYNPE